MKLTWQLALVALFLGSGPPVLGQAPAGLTLALDRQTPAPLQLSIWRHEPRQVANPLGDTLKILGVSDFAVPDDPICRPNCRVVPRRIIMDETQSFAYALYELQDVRPLIPPLVRVAAFQIGPTGDLTLIRADCDGGFRDQGIFLDGADMRLLTLGARQFLYIGTSENEPDFFPRKRNGIRIYEIQADGSLAQRGIVLNEGFNLANLTIATTTVDGTGFVYLVSTGGFQPNRLIGYRVRPADGTLQPILDQDTRPGVTSMVAAYDRPNLYVASFYGYPLSGIAVHRINADGTLAEIQFQTEDWRPPTCDSPWFGLPGPVTLDRHGYLYAWFHDINDIVCGAELRLLANRLLAYSIDKDGRITKVPSGPNCYAYHRTAYETPRQLTTTSGGKPEETRVYALSVASDQISDIRYEWQSERRLLTAPSAISPASIATVGSDR